MSGCPPAARDADEAIQLNCRLVGSAVVEVEKRARDEPISEIRIPLYAPTDLGYDTVRLASLLSELFLFAFARSVTISFPTRPIQGALALVAASDTNDAVCLFSGGVDSYAGILHAAREYHSVAGVFCAHSDQSKMIATVRRLEGRLLRRPNVTLEELRVPPLGVRGYVQLRGFLYMVAAGSVLAKTRASTLLVTECGPTMFQPRFSPLDSVTMTTHPEILRLARECLTLLLRREVRVATPQAQLTKAEVMASSPEKDGLRRTHSCISQRFGDHDGTCYGCVIRRLAAIAADVDDVRYRRNPLWDERAHGGNLLELLRFSADLLINPDRLEDFQLRHLTTLGVDDLFRRFALDNLAALYRIDARGGRLRRVIRAMLGDVARAIGLGQLQARLHELRDGTTDPSVGPAMPSSDSP
jgi:7-cyano-7-deazaguanine synthase in queuosine biosynthesis